MQADAYPAGLERWWIARVCSELKDIHPARAIARLEPFTARLSDLFTTERAAGFQSYADDPLALLAYGLFFFPQTFTRIRCILRECAAGGRAPALSCAQPLRVLDLGAGLGAASLALASLAPPQAAARAIRLQAVDQSAASLALMRELFDALHAELWPGTELTTGTGTLLDPSSSAAGPWDVILCSFALNEALEDRAAGAAEEWLQLTLNQLAPGGLLVLCEPALKATAVRLERLRDAAAASGRCRILAPCLHHAPCPLLQDGEAAWCHEVRRWMAPPSLHYLNRHLFRTVQFLKFSFLVLVHEPPQAPETDSAHARLVAPMLIRKGRFTTWGCAADGRIHPYEVQTRGMSASERKAIEKIERGSRVRWPSLHVLGDGKTLRAGAPPEAEG